MSSRHPVQSDSVQNSAESNYSGPNYSGQNYSVQNPHPFYARLCAAGPVHRLPMPDGRNGWLVTRYAEARAALADARLRMQPSSSGEPHRSDTLSPNGSPSGSPAADLAYRHHMATCDPPEHSRLRQVVSAAFTPRRVDALRPRIQQITDELLDTMASRGHADLVEEFARPLPNTVICELLGIPDSDRTDFRVWSDVLISPEPTSGQRHDSAITRMYAFLTELIAAKRRQPDDDLLSTLVMETDGGPKLSDAEILSTAFLLLTAGYETVSGLIGNAVLALLGNPTQLGLVRADPSLVPSTIDELLRYDGPIERVQWRWAAEDLPIGSVMVRRGDAVVIVLMAVNRDPRRFPDPDSLDVRRPALVIWPSAMGSTTALAPGWPRRKPRSPSVH